MSGPAGRSRRHRGRYRACHGRGLPADDQGGGARPSPVLIEGETGHGQGAGGARDPCGERARARARSSPSTARRCPRRCSRASSSATGAAPSPAPTATARACSRRRNGGTLFLDEIGEMPLSMQAKLLRVLQEGEVDAGRRDRVPAPSTCASSRRRNRDLDERGRARQRFREDLYYRLAGFPIQAAAAARAARGHPRAGASGSSPLAAARAPQAHRRASSPQALDCLVRYAWPGNVRELQNEIQRAVVLAEDGDAIGVATICRRSCARRHSPRPRRRPRSAAGNGGGAPRSPEPRSRRGTSPACSSAQGGNVSRTAEALGLSRMQLHRKLKEYNRRPLKPRRSTRRRRSR